MLVVPSLIHSGQRVLARTSADRLLPRRATTEVVAGQDFPIIWVCTEEEWELARREHRPPAAVAWPANAVQPTD